MLTLALIRFRDILSGPTSRETRGDMETTKRAWARATLDTKSDEAFYVCTLPEAAGVLVALADLSSSGSSVPVTGPQGIWVWDAQGHHLATIVMPEQPTNLA